MLRLGADWQEAFLLDGVTEEMRLGDEAEDPFRPRKLIGCWTLLMGNGQKKMRDFIIKQ